MRHQLMKVGLWFYGIGTALTGILNIAWRDFDGSHQPIQALGKNIPGQHLMASAAGIALVAAGLAVLWRRSAKIGAAASGVLYSIFVTLWLLRGYGGIHALGWRLDILLGVSFGMGQELMLIAPAAIVYASISSPDSRLRDISGISARWMLGLPPVIFGLAHLIGIRVFAKIVPPWMPFGGFLAAITGIAFILAGVAICSGIKDILALRLLASMLLLFEVLVEIPPVFTRLHNQRTWGAAVYNLAAIGACWIFAELLAGRGDLERVSLAANVARSRSNAAVA